MKSIITKPILEFQSFLDYKEDILRFKLDKDSAEKLGKMT